jgi:hypothetical protein
MPRQELATPPSMSDTAVMTKTGRDWAGWFDVLDQAGASTLEHRQIVALLSDTHGTPAWWRQMIAVEYERARGLRARHETASGYSVSVSRTLAVDVAALYAAMADAPARAQWFPRGSFVPSSQTPHKYLRGAWGSARLEIGLLAKSDEKSQIAVQVSRLARAGDVERQRSTWKAALARLQRLLEG